MSFDEDGLFDVFDLFIAAGTTLFVGNETDLFGGNFFFLVVYEEYLVNPIFSRCQDFLHFRVKGIDMAVNIASIVANLAYFVGVIFN
jgi:hypothetical protein